MRLFARRRSPVSVVLIAFCLSLIPALPHSAPPTRAATDEELLQQWTFAVTVVETAIASGLSGTQAVTYESRSPLPELSYSASEDLLSSSPGGACGAFTETRVGAGEGDGILEAGSSGFEPSVFGLDTNATWTALTASAVEGSTFNVTQTTTWELCPSIVTVVDVLPRVTPVFLPGSLEELDAMPPGTELELSYNDGGAYSSGGVDMEVSYTAVKLGAPIDSDLDGLTDLQEAAIGTNPFLADSDGDGISDGTEALGGVGTDTDGDTTIDALDTDSDNDGFLDGADECRTEPGTDDGCPPAPEDATLTLAVGAPVAASFGMAGSLSGTVATAGSLTTSVTPGVALSIIVANDHPGLTPKRVTCVGAKAKLQAVGESATVSVKGLKAGVQGRCVLHHVLAPLVFEARYDHTVVFGLPISFVNTSFAMDITGSSADARVAKICLVDQWLITWKKPAIGSKVFWFAPEQDALGDPVTEFEAGYWSGVPDAPTSASRTRQVADANCAFGASGFHWSPRIWLYAASHGLTLPREISKVWHDVSYDVYLTDCPTTPIRINLSADSATKKNRLAGDLDESRDGRLACTP